MTRERPANPHDLRPAVPKGSICCACQHRHRDCSDLDFERMPVLHVRDGIRFVRCTEFAGSQRDG